MSDLVIVAIISLVGTAIGTFGGIITSNKLTIYRIEQLEEMLRELQKENSDIPVIKEQIKTIFLRIEKLEAYINKGGTKQ